MAYDEGLAERIRSLLDDEPGVSEKKMFGGIAFLRYGHMFVGIVKDELMVRVGPEAHEQSLEQPHVRPMDFTGKSMLGYVFVAERGVRDDDQLDKWIRAGARFVAGLPRKPPKAATRKAPARRR
jgi:TfoX/Sxy family transcriptional regulator of competence genes